MAQTSPLHKRKWAGYLSGYRLFLAVVAVLVFVPFGAQWTSPFEGDVTLDMSVVCLVLAAVLIGLAFLSRGWSIGIGSLRIKGSTLLGGLGLLAMFSSLPLGDDEWKITAFNGTINGAMVLFVLTALAPYTDVLDGHFAREYPRAHKEDFFLFPGRTAEGRIDIRNGKRENDVPNAYYFILLPVALIGRFFFEMINDWDSRVNSAYLFAICLVLVVPLLGGTLVLERLKAHAEPVQAETAEVVQGWLAGMYYYLFPVPFAVLAFIHWGWGWVLGALVVYTICMAVVFFKAQERWLDRPESAYTGDHRRHF
jgi:hypothetical protein